MIKDGYTIRLIHSCINLALLNLCIYLGMHVLGLFGFYVSVNTDEWVTLNLLWLIVVPWFKMEGRLVRQMNFTARMAGGLVAYYGLCMIYIACFYYSAEHFGFVLFFIMLYSLFFGISRSAVYHVLNWARFKLNIVRPISVVRTDGEVSPIEALLVGGDPSLLHKEHTGNLNLVNAEHSSYIQQVKAEIRMAAEKGVNEIFLSIRSAEVPDLDTLMEEADQYCVRLKFVPDFSPALIVSNTQVRNIGDLPVYNLNEGALDQIENRFLKRVMDISVSLFIIVFICSWLIPLIGIIIKLSSPGPIFFRQLRNGRDNTEFWCYKFRSMRMNNTANTVQASRNDNRVTPFGKFLRRTSLDEFPQFFNVLMGDMTLVGPRPHMLKHTEQYRALIGRYMVRQYLKPGITGWAQVNGLRGETADIRQMERRVQYDIWYFENWSPLLDFKIFIMTFFSFLRGDKNAF